MARLTIFVALFFFHLELLQCHNLKLQKPNISPECETIGVCVSVENYPTKLVKGLIEKLKSENTIFNFDEPQPTINSRFDDYDEDQFKSITRPLVKSGTEFFGFPTVSFRHRHYNVAPRPTFNMRFNDKKPLSLCETIPQFVSLEGAKDKNGNWQFIINDSEEPLQVFRIETCRTPMGRCSEKIDFIPGYSGKCIQKMVFREMFYVNETKGIGRTYFEVPTCCSCTLLRKDDDE